MTISDYASIKELENEHRDGWGSTTALWVIVAALILFAIVYNWTRNCNEKVQFAVGMARMEGRLNCIEPDVRWAGQQLYAANGAISATVQGVGDMKQNFGNQLFQLNREVFYDDDPDGYEGQAFCRWVADIMAKGKSIDWEKYC